MLLCSLEITLLYNIIVFAQNSSQYIRRATYWRTLGQLVSCHKLHIQMFALGLPSGFDQPLQNLDDRKEHDAPVTLNSKYPALGALVSGHPVPS